MSSLNLSSVAATLQEAHDDMLARAKTALGSEEVVIRNIQGVQQEDGSIAWTGTATLLTQSFAQRPEVRPVVTQAIPEPPPEVKKILDHLN